MRSTGHGSQEGDEVAREAAEANQTPEGEAQATAGELSSAPDESARAVEIRGEMIRLGQLLQFAGVVDSGSDARSLIADGHVLVNGEAEIRRGRQLHKGDLVVVRVGDGAGGLRVS